jgi:hypothetical protein
VRVLEDKLNELEKKMLSTPPDSGLPFTLPEPDLMTLADAAAGAGDYPWNELPVETVANEIVKAVEGGKGLGEKIVQHL